MKPPHHRLVSHHRAPQHLGDGVASEVILGRPEPANGDDHLRPALGQVQGLHQSALVIAHGLPVAMVDAPLGQPLPQGGGVGVHRVAEQQLRTDRDDFCVHGFS
ncbi:MAG TPA: hypothetical protein DCY02_10165 [Armatimonadetes bacterium]|nr:hypothetical protein [Armatimonadota bacterium]